MRSSVAPPAIFPSLNFALVRPEAAQGFPGDRCQADPDPRGSSCKASEELLGGRRLCQRCRPEPDTALERAGVAAASVPEPGWGSATGSGNARSGVICVAAKECWAVGGTLRFGAAHR